MAEQTNNVVEFTLNQVDLATQNYIFETYQNITNGMGPFLTSLLTIYLIFVGIGIWQGKVQTNIPELISRCLKLATVLGLFLSWPTFSTLIVDFFTNAPDELAGKMAGEPSNSIFLALGDTFNRGMEAAGAAWSVSGWVTPLLLAGIIIIITCLQTAVALFLIVISKVALALLIGIAPIFVLLLLFESTRNMFTSWMQQVINYALITVLTVGVLLIMNEIYLIVLENALNQGIDGVDIGTVAPILCVGITSFLILKQVPNIASALGGGMALATQNRVSEITANGVNRFGSSARSAWSRVSSRRQSTNSIKG